MAPSSKIGELADLCKMSDRYVDFLGRDNSVPEERKAMILQAMGFDTDEKSIAKNIDLIKQKKNREGLDSVIVVRPHLPAVANLIQHQPVSPLQVKWTVHLEAGGEVSGNLALDAQLNDQTISELENQSTVYQITLPSNLPLGYHKLEIDTGKVKYFASLIQTPATSYQNEAIASGKKIWGSAIQLYTLRSDSNWGMGDFSDLKSLISDLADQGADFIGLNPIHALYPASPEHSSPYSPSNRSMINTLYIDPLAVSEYHQSKDLQRWYQSAEIQAELVELRQNPLVDYSGVSRLKNHAFKLLFETFEAKTRIENNGRYQKFEAYISRGGQNLFKHCLFDALLIHFKSRDINSWGWPKWPKAYQDVDSVEVQNFATEHVAEIRFHLYLQFIAAEQMETAHVSSTNKKMSLGIYRDLAVGADRGGSEVWSHPELYCLEASVGAPPDALGPVGQNWGLPPLEPDNLTQSNYEPYIELLRSNMQSCAALRIDHAMALYRLWWCPPGKTAADGVYVEYPFEDMLGILLLESQLNQCLVIAEDLGTVPDEVNIAFPRAQLFSNKVFYFEFDDNNGCTPPEAYATKALAIVANHDMPTLAAYWDASDLDLRMSLGMFTSDSVLIQEKENRNLCKQQILTALVKEKLITSKDAGLLIKSDTMTAALSQIIHLYMSGTKSQIVAVQLEDIMLVRDPVNVPGTSDEYANWRRKLTMSGKELFTSPDIQLFCEKLTFRRDQNQ